MTDIRKNDDICTQITTVKLPPDNQQEALNLMIERARFMTSQPGFVSIMQPSDQLHPMDEPGKAEGRAPVA